jgi:hypothetical protein
VQNRATTRYKNGEPIPNLIGTNWGNDTDGARCAYNDDDSWVFTYNEWFNI